MSVDWPVITSIGSRVMRRLRPCCSGWAWSCTNCCKPGRALRPGASLPGRGAAVRRTVPGGGRGHQVKANQEISASSLQSLDGPEATYREKNRFGYKGYVANVTETCDPTTPCN